MRARPARLPALIFGGLLTCLPALADDPPAPPKPIAVRPIASPVPVAPVPPATPTPPLVTSADVARERLATEARLKELASPEAKGKSATKVIGDLLGERRRLLGEWEKAARERASAEHPEPSPEREAAESKADLEKSRALLDQSARSPDLLLPEVFQARAQAVGPGGSRSEARLGEMKEAIDAARNELKERSAELEALRSEGTRSQTAQIASLRAERDKLHQGLVALNAGRGDRDGAVRQASTAEGRDFARDRLANFEWESRVEAEQIAALEARIALASKRLDLGAVRVQARASRVQLAKKVLDRMEDRYSAQAERQRSDLKRAVAKEETRAAQSVDPLERRRARRTADLLELESQVVAYEKAYATSGHVSHGEQTALADAAEGGYAELRKMVDDGNVSPLDALRLKNDFRRIAPERAQIVRTDLAASDAEVVAYENALTDAEIDLVNDSRDDRYDRESLLEQIPRGRRAEASAMLEELEARHKALLNRRRAVLQKLASRSEATHQQVARRIGILDQQYAFIRTHIFWVRDAEPLGPATVAHARDESIRTARALARLALEPADRSLWGHVSAEFVLAVVAMVVLPWPLLVGQKALDRLRLGAVPRTALGLADFPSAGSERR